MIDEITKKLEALDLTFVSEEWFIKSVIILSVAIAANLAAYLIFKYLKRLSDYTANSWDDALIKAAERPVSVVIWFLAIISIADTFNKHKGAFALEFLAPASKVGIILCVTWFLIRLINYVAKDVIIKRKNNGENVDYTTVDAISKLARLIVFALALLIILQNLGFSISGLLAAGGVSGIVLGFAAKDSLANFFGGFSIYMDRPFGVGDWIKSPDRQIEGIVEQIGWRQTKIRTFSKTVLYVPNSLFSNIILENPSRMTSRKIDEVIKLRYEDIDKIKTITEDLKKVLENDDKLEQKEGVAVNFNTIGTSSLDVNVLVFTKTTSYNEYIKVKQDVLLKIADVIYKNKAQFALPTSNIFKSDLKSS